MVNKCLEKSSQISNKIYWNLSSTPMVWCSEQRSSCLLISPSHTATRDSQTRHHHSGSWSTTMANGLNGLPTSLPYTTLQSPATLSLWLATSSHTGFLANSNIWQFSLIQHHCLENLLRLGASHLSGMLLPLQRHAPWLTCLKMASHFFLAQHTFRFIIHKSENLVVVIYCLTLYQNTKDCTCLPTIVSLVPGTAQSMYIVSLN